MREKNVSAQILDGSATAAAIREDLAAQVKELTAGGKRAPGLAVVLVGDDPASHIYVKNKVNACKKTGIQSWLFQFPADATPSAVLSKLHELNEDNSVDGILVQLPLPKHIDTEEVLEAISPEKDADGLHCLNVGLLATGKAGPRPCTPLGVIRLLERYGVDPNGQTAVVIGRSNLVGKPVALMLLEKNATVTMCHSKSKNLDQIARGADILVVAAGRPQMVTASWIKPGAVVIDVGIHRATNDKGESKIVGDVEFDGAAQVASKITPVPGGVGPMTIAMLLSNTVQNYRKRMNVRETSPALK